MARSGMDTLMGQVYGGDVTPVLTRRPRPLTRAGPTIRPPATPGLAPLAPKSLMPTGGTLSPKGDLSKLSQAEAQKAFRRPIKRDGPNIVASAYLPVRPFTKAGGDNS